MIVDPIGNGNSLAIFSSSLHSEKTKLFKSLGRIIKSDFAKLNDLFRTLNRIKKGRVKIKKCEEKVILKPADLTTPSKPVFV
jgi:hypothetical protein